MLYRVRHDDSDIDSKDLALAKKKSCHAVYKGTACLIIVRVRKNKPFTDLSL